MDDFRYVRHTELAAMAETPEGRNSPAVDRALKDPATLYRFPFPEEDGQDWDEIGQRDFFVPRIILSATEIKGAHRSITHCITGPGGAYQVSVYLPCPYLLTKYGEPEDPTEPTLCSALPDPLLVIVGERVREGRVRTIFKCIYCEILAALHQAELDLLWQQNKDRVDRAILARLTPAE